MAWRAGRHHLAERAGRGRMLEVVADLAGVHAQLMSSAELTLWARVDGLAPDAVQRALWDERSLVKSWAMRGTLHLLPAAEYPLWRAGFSTYRHYLRPVWFRNFGITPGELEQLMAGIAEALDGRLLTRQELGEEVTRRTGSADLGEKVRDSWGPSRSWGIGPRRCRRVGAPSSNRLPSAGISALARTTVGTSGLPDLTGGCGTGAARTPRPRCSRSPGASSPRTARPVARTTPAGGP